MEFWKFKDMIKQKSLFFTRLSKLLDHDEGTIPEYDQIIEGQVKDYLINFYEGIENYKIATGSPLPERQKNLEKLRHNSVVNCWHINLEESKSMWNLDNGKDIAIKTTIGNLKESLDDSYFPILLDRIDYLNFSKQGIGKEWIHNKHLFAKQQGFQHENEIRLLISSNFKYSNQKEDYDFEGNGIHIHVNLDKLIEEIYISSNDVKLTKLQSTVKNYLPYKPIVLSSITR